MNIEFKIHMLFSHRWQKEGWVLIITDGSASLWQLI